MDGTGPRSCPPPAAAEPAELEEALPPKCDTPTSAAAVTHSPLSVFDFMKRTSVGYVTAGAYPELAKHARVLALYEGFDAHANAGERGAQMSAAAHRVPPMVR